MTPEKQKEIAVAFAAWHYNNDPIATNKVYDRWLLTEEGKRLTAEELATESLEKSAIECMKQISESLVTISGIQKQLNDNQIVLNDKFDRFEGRLKGNLFGE